MKGQVTKSLDIINRLELWLFQAAPFLYLCGRVFTKAPIQGSPFIRIFEHKDDGSIYHVGDYSYDRNWQKAQDLQLDLSAFITHHGNFDPERLIGSI